MKWGRDKLHWLHRITARRAGHGLPWQPDRRQMFILPTRGGAILGMATLALLLGALNYNNNLAIALAFLLISQILISAVSSQRHLRNTRLLEMHAPPVHAGQTLQIILYWRLPNGQLPLRVWMADTTVTEQTDQVQLQLSVSKRGLLTLPPLRLESRYPLGLFRSWCWWQHEKPLLIWPQPESTPPPLPGQAHGRSGHQPTGELTELDRWQPGEPMSRVAWKHLARHGQWLSRQPEPESDLQHPIVFRLQDTGLTDREAAIRRLTAWILMAERHQRPYGLVLAQGVELPPGHGERHLYRCLERLALA